MYIKPVFMTHGSPLDSIPDFHSEVQGSNPWESRKIFSKENLMCTYTVCPGGSEVT